jgi:dihydroxyacetone kinase-like predicted kinase
MPGYILEFILRTYNADKNTVRNSLAEFAEELQVVDCLPEGQQKGNFKISLQTEDPTVIFDICAQFGRIKSVKIDEIK